MTFGQNRMHTKIVLWKGHYGASSSFQAERITVALGDKQATFKLLQTINLKVQRGNIASILGTLPSPKSFNQIFYL